MLITRYIQQTGVHNEADDGSWFVDLTVDRAKGNPSREIDLLNVFVSASDLSTAEFVDDDHPTLSFRGITAFETHLTTASPGRNTSRFPAWQ